MTHRVSILLAIMAAGLLAGCAEDTGERTYQGYVEGEFLLVGPKVTGQLVSLDVSLGERAEQGAPLFSLDATEAAARRDQAAARLEQAQAQLSNLLEGKRPLELAVIESQIEEAQARVDVAEREHDRARSLRDQRVFSESRLDNALAARDAARATLARFRNELATAGLPAREHEVEAARRNVTAARAQLEEARAQLDDYCLRAPKAGQVQEIFYRQGEVVPAGRPVVSLLPPENRKVRFFVPEPVLARVHTGDTVSVACDGCPEGLAARITFVSDEAEFTPPVIFSVEARAKLVYKVEAVPEGPIPALKPGQPVDVTLRNGDA